MLSSIPTKEKHKPRNWTVMVLIGLIVVLIAALSGITGLYLLNSQTSHSNIIVVNQTSNNTTNSQPVQDTSNSNQISDTSSIDNSRNTTKQPISNGNNNNQTN